MQVSVPFFEKLLRVCLPPSPPFPLPSLELPRPDARAWAGAWVAFIDGNLAHNPPPLPCEHASFVSMSFCRLIFFRGGLSLLLSIPTFSPSLLSFGGRVYGFPGRGSFQSAGSLQDVQFSTPALRSFGGDGGKGSWIFFPFLSSDGRTQREKRCPLFSRGGLCSPLPPPCLSRLSFLPGARSRISFASPPFEGTSRRLFFFFFFFSFFFFFA